MKGSQDARAQMPFDAFEVAAKAMRTSAGFWGAAERQRTALMLNMCNVYQ